MGPVTVDVLVADDQPLVRAGLGLLLAAQPDIRVVGEAGDGVEAVELAERLRPHVVLMDVRMPRMDGITAVRALCADRPAGDELTKVLVLTTFDDDEAVYASLSAGASGFLLKHAAPQDLITAVHRVAAGEAWIDPAVAGRVIAALANVRRTVQEPARLVAVLTPREREVLVLMAHGLSNTEIREKLVVSEATVKTHVSRIVMKTGARDRTQAVVYAYRSGLVNPDDPALLG